MTEIHLRKLEIEDAPYMLEWMQEPSIACFFRFDAANMTEDKCRKFIEDSNQYTSTKHYAIADEQEEYLGTISLKDIDYEKKSAEYAISIRKKAHGTGVAMEATKEILKIAFSELGLVEVFLNVLTDNIKANRFYEKAGFEYQYTEDSAVDIYGEMKSLNWYILRKDDYWEKRDSLKVI